MKKNTFLTLILLLMFPFLGISQANSQFSSYTLSGSEFSSENLISAAQMQEKYQNLKPGDTVSVAFKAEVASVCQQKGCWMNLDLGDTDEVMVRFKDYAFFVPKNIGGKEVVVHGKAFVSELSVEEQQHYAEDAGKSSEEIQAINKPAKKLSFLADGVKIKK